MNEFAPISFDRVTKCFGAQPDAFVACGDLSFDVAEGETVAIVGETGCGKSTALQLLLGLQKPTQGCVRMLGLDPFEQFAQLRGLVGIIFQTDRLLPWRTALGNIEFGLQVLRTPKLQRREIAERWLERLGLSRFAHAYPHELSGGMRQRVSIARTFAIEPRILLADEAFSALDEITAAAVRADLLRLVQEQRTTTIFITHSVAEAAEIAERVLVFGRPGHIIEDIPSGELKRRDGSVGIVEARIRDALRTARARSANPLAA